jgi:DNA replication and repair protein RecF
MPIREIDLVAFRNHDHLRLTFGDGINIIWGRNGSGKTAVLEAIHTLSLGRSFRTVQHRHLLKEGREALQVTGVFTADDRAHTVRLNQTRDGRRKFLIDDVPLTGLKELVGQNPVVILSPEEQKLTRGNPAVRRAFFDRLFSVVSHPYLLVLAEYTRALRQRNKALHLVREKKATPEAVTAWNGTLVKLGLEIWSRRADLMETFRAQLEHTIQSYGEAGIHLICRYEPQRQPSPEAYETALQRSLTRDLHIGQTHVGPHRDQYDFVFQGKALKQFGSQGEHKLTLVLVKLAEFHFIRDLTGKTPTLLLDDLFAELDFQRSEGVLALLDRGVQAIITTTDLMSVEEHGIDLNRKENRSIRLETPCNA